VPQIRYNCLQQSAVQVAVNGLQRYNLYSLLVTLCGAGWRIRDQGVGDSIPVLCQTEWLLCEFSNRGVLSDGDPVFRRKDNGPQKIARATGCQAQKGARCSPKLTPLPRPLKHFGPFTVLAVRRIQHIETVSANRSLFVALTPSQYFLPMAVCLTALKDCLLAGAYHSTALEDSMSSRLETDWTFSFGEPFWQRA
jgi:hypothetical protein